MFGKIGDDLKIVNSPKSLYGYARVLFSHAFSPFPRFHFFGPADYAQIVSYRMRAVSSLLFANSSDISGRMRGKVFVLKALFRTVELAQRKWKYDIKPLTVFRLVIAIKNASRLAHFLSPNISANDCKSNKMPSDGPKLIKGCNRLASYEFVL
jgi:hypothetical protein